MQSSTWNDTNQHWIPQFLLKGFGIKKRASYVHEMDKQTGSIRTCKVKEVASKQRLLTERDDDLMKTIEKSSTRVVGQIRNGCLDISQKDRQALDSLVFALMRNDPYSGFDEARTREETVQSVSLEFAAAVGNQGGSIDLQRLNDFVDQSLNHDYLDHAMAKGDSIALRTLGLMGLQTHLPVDREFFVIGDSPVLAVRGTLEGVPNLLNPGSQVILPIHSRRVLIYSWDTPANLIQPGGVLDRQQVRSLNQDYFRGTKCRYIYGRDRESLRRARMPQIQSTGRVRSMRVNDGWRTMQSEVRKISASRVTRDVERRRARDSLAGNLVERARADREGRTRQGF